MTNTITQQIKQKQLIIKPRMQPAPTEPDAPNKSQSPSGVRKRILDFSYNLDDPIGEGYSSKVFKGVNEKSGQPVAIKVVDMNKMTDNVLREMLAQEIESLQQLKGCEQILHLEEAISTINNTYIITELCPDGDLSDVISTGCLQEAEAAELMQQVIKGYLEIYKRGIVHRDLKPSNVFLQGYKCRIADFGFSAKAARLTEPCNYNVGSPLYMAPQALLRNFYSYESDIWALGIIYYELLFGRTPWIAKSQKDLAHTIKKNSILTLIPSTITRTSLSFLLSTLNPDLRDRMTPQELENFEFTLDPVVRYARFKKTLEEERLRSMENYQIVRGMLPPRYNPRPLDPAYNVPVNYPTDYKQPENQTQIYYEKGVRKQSAEAPINEYRQSQASAKFVYNRFRETQPQQQFHQKTNQHRPVEPVPQHQKRQANAQKPRVKLPVAEEGRPPNAEEQQISHALLSQVHLCRFLSKVIVLMPNRQSELRRALLGIVYYKLDLLSSCAQKNPYGIPTIETYRSTSDFQKIMSISQQYQTKYSQSLGVPPGTSTTTYQGIMQMLRSQIKRGYHSLQQHSSEMSAELLDYLITTYQLIGLMLQTTLREFSYRSNIHTIANQSSSSNPIDEACMLKLEQKLKFLGLV